MVAVFSKISGMERLSKPVVPKKAKAASRKMQPLY
jgi:hypothetical protein